MLFFIIIIRLANGGRRNNGPVFSAGQWPSLTYKAEEKCAALLIVVVAVSYVISSSFSTFTCLIVCLNLLFEELLFFPKKNNDVTLDIDKTRLGNLLDPFLHISMILSTLGLSPHGFNFWFSFKRPHTNWILSMLINS